MKKINTDHLKHVLYAARIRVRDIFLYRYRSIALLLVGAMVAIGGAVLANVFIEGALVSDKGEAYQELDTAAIDNLELWLESRQTAYENPPAIRSSIF